MSGVVLTGTNYIDDGNVIYLNGVEISRFNMPAGAPTFQTTAPVANPGGFPNVGGGEPVRVVMQIPLDALTNGNANPLVVGENTIAVEGHNQGTGSSDTVFGMWLYGGQSIAPCTDGIQPTNRTAIACRNSTFTVVLPSNCGVPAPTIQWFGPNGLIAGQSGTSMTVSNLTAADAGQYYAVLSNGVGNPVESRRAVLTVNPDTQGPKIVSVVATGGVNNEIVITFDEAVNDASASDTFEYSIVSTDGTHIISTVTALRDATDFSIVRLTTDAPLRTGLRYNYTIGTEVGIEDACVGNVSIGLTGSVLIQAILITADDVVQTWRYDDNGVDMGTTWKDVNFNDSAWKSGKAVFDAKDVGRTMVSGLNVQTVLQRRIPGTAFETVNVPTMYFRTHVNIPAGAIGVSIRTVADDGYVLYVNGQEISRLRVPAGNEPFAAYSNGGTVGDGNYEGPVAIPSSVLNIGADNVFAVLLKQNDTTSSDITWGMELSAQVTGVEVIPVAIVTQPTSVTVTEQHTFSLSVVASGTAPQYQWYHGATAIPGANSATYTKTFATSADAGDYHVNVSNPLNNIDSSTVTVTVRPVLIPYTHTWKYETNSQDATLSGTPWYSAAFNDAAWPSGPGPLGVETTAATLARLPVPIGTVLPPPNTNGFITTYFRTTITVPTLSAGQYLALFHTIDDGAVFYVDGQLALRYNMTNDPPILSSAVAPGTAPGDGDAMVVSTPVSIPPGQHTIAVEVHQNAGTSSDSLFGAELRVASGQSPSLTITHTAATTVNVTWTANPNYTLYSAPAVTGPFTPVAGNPQGAFTAQTAGVERFFQLRLTP